MCNRVKTCILGMMPGKRRRGASRSEQYTRASLDENIRVVDDKTAWRKGSCAAGAANVRTDDAD